MNAPKPLNKEEFASVLKIATDSLDLAKIMKSGFKACGLWPFDVEIILTRLNKKKIIQVKNSNQNIYNNNLEKENTFIKSNEHEKFLVCFEKDLPLNLL